MANIARSSSEEDIVFSSRDVDSNYEPSQEGKSSKNPFNQPY